MVRQTKVRASIGAIGSKKTSQKPGGQVTRGKTARNRLRRVDNFVCLYDENLITRTDGEFVESLCVDLGYGDEPHTALEMAARLRRINPATRLLGIEIDQDRVDRGLVYSDALTDFRLGGFNVSLRSGGTALERVRLIRAFNVLRQYHEPEVEPAYRMMAEGVVTGGLLIEGTSTPSGSLWVSRVARRLESDEDPWSFEALVFSTNFAEPFTPEQFQQVLPKSMIHRMVVGQDIYEFMAAWKDAVELTAYEKTWGDRHWFASSAKQLRQQGYDIQTQKKWLNRGYLVWRRKTVRHEPVG